VFVELLAVFNCSVVSFGAAVNFHLNRTLEYVTVFYSPIKPSGNYMYQYYFAHVIYLLIICNSQGNQRLFP
jgi:hypothetical protein